MVQKTIIGVIGASRVDSSDYEAARAVGKGLAEAGVAIVCGGLGGVMEAACQGVQEVGGTSIGILPGAEASSANQYVSLAVPTNLGHARNVIIAHTARALIAVAGGYGTLSEIAIALKLGRPVIAMGQWSEIPGVIRVETAAEAVAQALAIIRRDECLPT